MERRAPSLVTTTWWRKDRDPAAVFVDYNQNARDHTIAAAYSLRGVPDGTVSTPISWHEVDAVEPRAFTLATVPARFAELGTVPSSEADATPAALKARLENEIARWKPVIEAAGQFAD